jgi:hypothetical protein
VIVAAAYLRPLVFGDTFALRDQLTWTLPARAHLHDALAHGRLPEWWDAVGLGIPFAGNPGYGVCYPPAWIVALVPSAFGSDLLLIAHVAWLALGTAALARRLGADRAGGVVAGVAAALSGYVASVMVDGIPVLILAWTPWVVWGVDRLALADGRRARATAALQLSALWAAQILSGVPGVVDTALLAVGWTLVRAERRLPTLAWLAGSVVAALPLAMVSLLPALHLLGPSERAGGLPFADATVWSLHPLRLAELAWPRLPLPDESDGRHLERTWAVSVYLGAPVVALAGYAIARGERHARAFALVAAALLVLALGRYTPLYALYRTIVLPERLLRYPEKHVSGVVIVTAVLAGVGFTRAFAVERCRRLVVVLAVAALALAAGHAFGASLACVVVAVALVVRRPSLALCAIALHLCAEGWIAQPLVPRQAVTRVPALLEPIAGAATVPRPRIYRLPGLAPRSNAETPVEASVAQRDTGLENGGASFGFAHVPGYEPALEARWHAVWDAGAATGARVLERFDVQWVILPSALAARTPFVPRAELGGVVLAENQRRRPRAFVAARWRFAGDDEARAALFDPAHADELQLAGSGPPPSASGLPSTGGGEVTPCAIRATRPEALELDCRAASDGYAVLLDAFADGWTATVDGAATPIVRADLVARAVPLRAGAHTIAMRYRTPGLRAGALVSLVSWLLLLALLLRYGTSGSVSSSSDRPSASTPRNQATAAPPSINSAPNA